METLQFQNEPISVRIKISATIPQPDFAQIMLDQVAWYKYPGQNQHDLWYQCPKRPRIVVYLHFPDGWEGEHEVQLALKVAIEKDTCAIKVTRKCPESAL